MAKIVIEIEDRSDGKVAVKATPNFMEMMQMNESGFGLTPAHGYAIGALNEIRKQSKSNEPTQIIKIPRIGR